MITFAKFKVFSTKFKVFSTKFKVFSAKFGGVASFGCTSKQTTIVFSMKVSHYTYMLYIQRCLRPGTSAVSYTCQDIPRDGTYTVYYLGQSMAIDIY